MDIRFARVGVLLSDPEGTVLLERSFPDWTRGELEHHSHWEVAQLVRITPRLRDDPAALASFWGQVAAAMPTQNTAYDGPFVPAPGVGGETGAAPWRMERPAGRWGAVDILFDGPADGNPFIDVELSANITTGGRHWRVGGFYDGDGTYRLRVLAEEEGAWQFVTESNVAALDGVCGEFTVGPAEAGRHGPVRADGFHFVHQDGTRHLSIGTTAYAWIHQSPERRRETLETLRTSAFTKMRMLLFPKHMVYNRAEPSRFPFERRADGSFDHSRFDVGFFQRLDRAIQALGDLGIQADLILFHPYDKWGFVDLGPHVDAHVVRYVVRRYAGYANVWWSLANEHDDPTFTKTTADWDRIGELVKRDDPHGHLVSIHNIFNHFDHSKEWITHASIQKTDRYRTTENITQWREAWGKPVVVDECGYEGDIEYDWGNLTPQEMLRRFWEGTVRGGYVGHGETYHDPDDELWWAKGGRLHGESHSRLWFLEKIVSECPGGILEPIDAGFEVPCAGARDRYLVIYHGQNRPREQHVLLAPGRWHIDVLDTWDCTITRLEGTYRNAAAVPLPAKPFVAIRLVRAGD